MMTGGRYWGNERAEGYLAAERPRNRDEREILGSKQDQPKGT